MRVSDGQSVLDLAIQCCGSAEAGVDFALENGISITDALTAGQELRIAAIANKDTAQYYSSKGLRPATWIDGTDAGGIDFWAIGVDFVVQ